MGAVLNHDPRQYKGVTATYIRGRLIEDRPRALVAWARFLEATVRGERDDTNGGSNERRKAMSKRGTATKVKSYTGILKEPMRLPRKTVLGPTLEEQNAQSMVAFLDRVVALFKHYGIDPKKDNAWSDLAVSLARDHVPGFQYDGRKPGAPNKRAGDDVRIYFRVKLLVAEGQSISNACRIIEKRGVVKDLKWSAIRQRYYDLLKKDKLGWHLNKIEDQIGKDLYKEALSFAIGQVVVK
ncbi:MAG: hypothetical protein IH905_14385 [Proteobacteria bacterium]|nr:hypothetical protein [Pseudomonadota bacterium]